uniref:Uncharacterized protein n=1 Tax=Anguilla anguilla TaxID=7936 RepID=A0A0E9T6S6_ANGAN
MFTIVGSNVGERIYNSYACLAYSSRVTDRGLMRHVVCTLGPVFAHIFSYFQAALDAQSGSSSVYHLSFTYCSGHIRSWEA